MEIKNRAAFLTQGIERRREARVNRVVIYRRKRIALIEPYYRANHIGSIAGRYIICLRAKNQAVPR